LEAIRPHNLCQFVWCRVVINKMRDATNPPISLADQIERIERALSVTEVAQLLSLCRASVYRYIDAGIIPAIRIGTTLRVDPKPSHIACVDAPSCPTNRTFRRVSP